MNRAILVFKNGVFSLNSDSRFIQQQMNIKLERKHVTAKSNATIIHKR